VQTDTYVHLRQLAFWHSVGDPWTYLEHFEDVELLHMAGNDISYDKHQQTPYFAEAIHNCEQALCNAGVWPCLCLKLSLYSDFGNQPLREIGIENAHSFPSSPIGLIQLTLEKFEPGFIERKGKREKERRQPEKKRVQKGGLSMPD
jgi:hypothetical protein